MGGATLFATGARWPWVVVGAREGGSREHYAVGRFKDADLG